jgi:hypothetical protein
MDLPTHIHTPTHAVPGELDHLETVGGRVRLADVFTDDGYVGVTPAFQYLQDL